jgi:hypothetical protein
MQTPDPADNKRTISKDDRWTMRFSSSDRHHGHLGAGDQYLSRLICGVSEELGIVVRRIRSQWKFATRIGCGSAFWCESGSRGAIRRHLRQSRNCERFISCEGREWVAGDWNCGLHFLRCGSNAVAEIGTGRVSAGNSAIGNVTILAGNVSGSTSATLRYGGPGIGTARGYNGYIGIGNLTLLSGNVSGSSTAGTYGGSGIGTGCSDNANSIMDIEKLTILNGKVTGNSKTNGDRGGPGIGTGCGASSWPTPSANSVLTKSLSCDMA